MGSYTDNQDNLKRIKKEGLPFLSKPYTSEILLRKVAEVLARR